jgi:hypothetical protein
MAQACLDRDRPPSTLTGAAAVGTAGGIIGALTQAGISPDDAEIYAESLRRGGALVRARVNDADKSRLPGGRRARW